MADCTCVPGYLISAAECAMSDRARTDHLRSLWAAVGGKPDTDHGVANETCRVARIQEPHARKLVWC